MNPDERAVVEAIGLIAGCINIWSTIPVLRRPPTERDDPAELRAQMISRSWQLLANVIWFSYAIASGLFSLTVTTTVLNLCLTLVIVRLRKALAKATQTSAPQ